MPIVLCRIDEIEMLQIVRQLLRLTRMAG